MLEEEKQEETQEEEETQTEEGEKEEDGGGEEDAQEEVQEKESEIATLKEELSQLRAAQQQLTDVLTSAMSEEDEDDEAKAKKPLTRADLEAWEEQRVRKEVIKHQATEAYAIADAMSAEFPALYEDHTVKGPDGKQHKAINKDVIEATFRAVEDPSFLLEICTRHVLGKKPAKPKPRSKGAHIDSGAGKGKGDTGVRPEDMGIEEILRAGEDSEFAKK